MTTRRLRIDHRAAEEFEAAADWYDAQLAGLGHDFIDAVNDVLQALRETPGLGVQAPGVDRSLNIRRVLVRKFPYSVVYVDAVDDIVVLAIAHGHRRPGYWRDRIPG